MKLRSGEVAVVIDIKHQASPVEGEVEQLVCLNLWCFCMNDVEFSNSPEPALPASACTIQYTNRMEEVYQSNYIIWYPVNHLAGLAFVFFFEDIQVGLYPCSGMNTGFSVRFRYHSGTRMKERLNGRDHFPFHGSFCFGEHTAVPICPLPWHIWNTINLCLKCSRKKVEQVWETVIYAFSKHSCESCFMGIY